MELTGRQVVAWRLGRHHLTDLDAPDAVGTAARLCGVQAQVLAAARLAVRTRGAADTVPDDLAAGRLVRTWAMRGTLHLLPVAGPGGVRDWLALTTAGRTWTKGAWQRTFVGAGQLDAFARVVEDLLADGRAATREDLVEAARASGDDHLADQVAGSWGAVLKPLAWQGLLVQGPPGPGGRATFTRPDVTVPGWPAAPDADDAGPLAVRAHAGVHGPTTPEAFDAFVLRGATPKARLRRWFAAAGLEPVTVDGRPALARPEDLAGLAAARTDVVRLLPAFDQLVLGPGTRDELVVPAAHRADVSRAAGWISPVVVTADGVVGTWEPRDGEPAVTLFDDAPAPAPAALAAEIARTATLL